MREGRTPRVSALRSDCDGPAGGRAGGRADNPLPGHRIEGKKMCFMRNLSGPEGLLFRYS